MSDATGTARRYIGRFAPSPTGPLHFGSLIAATGSYLQARSKRGLWLVRIEDLDLPREQPGAAAHILRTLDAYGFQWDREVVYQSRRTPIYHDALSRLLTGGHVYYCGCTRTQIEAQGRIGTFGPVYPGTCRARKLCDGRGRSLRVATHDGAIGFDDAHLGHFSQRLESETGDFVIRRADGQIAYHLAVVMDDAAQGITQVVRGADLLDSTPRQIYLQRLLGLPTPNYLHLPVAVNESGQKLSKQTHAKAISLTDPRPYLAAALRFLNHGPPSSLQAAGLGDLWRWAIETWSPDRIPRVHRIERIQPV